MKFAKAVFWIAGAWGMLVLTPLYFLLDSIGLSTPPRVTHPEFFYAFTGTALVWQFAFFTIAMDPARFRPMIIAAVLEKLTYVVTLVVLYLRGRIGLVESIPAIPDGILCLLFVVAFFKLTHLESTRYAHGMK